MSEIKKYSSHIGDDRPQRRDTCPTCGSPVRIVSSGCTHFYEPAPEQGRGVRNPAVYIIRTATCILGPTIRELAEHLNGKQTLSCMKQLKNLDALADDLHHRGRGEGMKEDTMGRILMGLFVLTGIVCTIGLLCEIL